MRGDVHRPVELIADVACAQPLDELAAEGGGAEGQLPVQAADLPGAALGVRERCHQVREVHRVRHDLAPLRVAVDGPPAAGKTTLADELALLLRSRGREVIRASTESFHLPRAQRYRHGEFSPEANYHETFDYDTLRRVHNDEPRWPAWEVRSP